MEIKAEKKNVLTVMKNFDLMEILPKILNVDKNTFKISPSEFIKEMSLTMEERHKKLVHTANMYKIIDSSYPSQFKVIPHILVFQGFEGRETYSLNLEVKNVGKTLLPLNMHCPSSEFFSAVNVGNTVNKVAPGLAAEYEITFTPDEARDYGHHIQFRSKTFNFQVPIVAIGPRALLDIPDQIILNPTGVKIPISKFILIRNIGNSPAVFNFDTKNEHFQMNPQKGILPVHETMLLNISCCSFKVGEVSETVCLMLETGEKLSIALHGSAETLCVRLDKSTVVHEDTYVGLKRCKTVRLTNNSTSVIKFCCKKYKSVKEELEVANSLKEKYTEMAKMELFKDAKVIYYGLSNAHQHELSCDRILKDEIKIFEKEEFKFNHPFFSIFPESGEVWPKSFTELTTVFHPAEPGIALVEAYLEVTGRESRMPLRVKGFGMGPKIVLNVKILDINYVYLCTSHKYEVVAENKGDIDGTLEYKSVPLIFGGKVKVTPESRFLKPKECAAFLVSFTSNRLGEFTESLGFIIKESGDKVDFVFKGKIVCPTLHFDIKQIDFGTVPFGFPASREVTLSNLSLVPVSFSVRVVPDGETPSLSYEDFAKITIKPSLHTSPKEFQIEPQESVVEALCTKKVTLTLTANRTGVFFTNLVVDMWDSDSSSVYCPIHFRCETPQLIVHPENIISPFCFINFPYTRSVIIQNESKVDGFFYILPSDPNEESTTCSASVSQGVIEAHGSFRVDITFITSALGRQVVTIRMLTFGLHSPQEMCTISCVGQGAVLTLSKNSVNWGEVQLLQESTKKLMISNESPIPAHVTMTLNSRTSPWTVEPKNFDILPEKSKEVDITLFLFDPGMFKDTLKILVHNGKLQQVLLSATGVGNSLITEPVISPDYNLGILYCSNKYEFEFQMINRSSKSYNLLWTPYPDYKSLTNEKFPSTDLPFKIVPLKLDLPPKENKTVVLEAYETSPGVFQQKLYCFGTTTGSTKELFLTSQILAEFVEPLIKTDKKEIFFWLNVKPDGVESKLQDVIALTNLSVLPMTINLRIAQPFSLLLENDRSTYNHDLFLGGNETIELNIRFEAQLHPMRRSKIYDSSLSVTIKDYSKKIFLALQGEINYPHLLVFPKQINFENIPLGATAYSEIYLVNISPLTVFYEVSWNMITSEWVFYENSETVSDNFFFEMQPEENYGEHLTEEHEALSETGTRENMSTNKTEFSISPEFPSLKMPEITIMKSDIKEALFPLTRNYFTCEEELIEAYRMTRSSDVEDEDTLPGYAKLCDITPFYGKLEPYASQTLAIKFSGNYSVNAHLEALIEVLSGPTETIKIDAKVGEVDFHLSACELDFGKQLFCETKSQTLKLQNTGALPFFFEAYTRSSQLCEFSDDFPLGMDALTVTPHNGNVEPYSVVDLIVRYHPGVPGKFEDSFKLQIAYLDPIFIKVKGFGVFPQVYIFLPRPELDVDSPETGYAAVASLTHDWILAGYFTGSGPCESFYEKPYRSRESGIDNLPENDLEEGEWEFIRYAEIVPSTVDINLALERILGFQLVSKNSTNSATFAVYARTIPDFCVPAYELDFRVCVIGRPEEQNITVRNYGPLPVIIYGIFEPSLKEDGISIRLKNRNEIKVGASLSLAVSFLPRKKRFKRRHQILETFFYFEIYHGPRIPVKIKATVTYPHVISSTNTLNFCRLICGRCKIMTLKLKNPGLVAAKWSLHFTKKSANFCSDLPEEGVDGRSMFYSTTMSGCLLPNEYCRVQVCFQPKKAGLFLATLVIHVVCGLEEVKVCLSGEAVEPKLILSQSCLDFGSTLPFPNKVEKSFVITNPCEFPIEFYFPTMDDQIYEEDKILRAVMLYYQTKEILLPVRSPGEGLPIEIVTFYHMLLDDLNTKYMEEEQEKVLAEKENQILAGEDEVFIPAAFPGKTRIKNRRLFSRSQTSGESGRASHVFDNTKEYGVQSIFEEKTSQEIDQMLQEHILKMEHKAPMFDPLKAALKSDMESPEEEEYTPGTLVIFHGAPFTNSIQWANKIALNANLTALNIDRIVLEEAAIGRTQAGITAKELIEQAYWDSGYDDRKKVTFECVDCGEADPLEHNYAKEFEEIQRKFESLLELNENIMRKNKNSAPGSAKSEVSKKDTPKTKNLNVPVVSLPEDLILDILKYRFSLEVVNGLVIEGLHSSLITSSTKSLETVLKAAGKLKDIIFVLLLNTYEQYSQYIRNKQAEEELSKLKNRKKLLRIVEEEPEEVFEDLDLSPEFAEIIRAEYLSQRHESHDFFLRGRIKFYEKLKIECKRKGVQVPLLSLNAPGDAADANDKKEKNKKKDSKGTKLSEVSGRKTESEAKSAKLQKDSTELLFLAFEIEYGEMKNLIEAWDQRKGGPVVQQVDAFPEPKLKKGQTPRKAEPPPVSQPVSSDPGRGVFLWIVDVSKPDNNSLPGVGCLLKSIIHSPAPVESDTWPQENTESTTLGVVPYPPTRMRGCENTFIVSVCETFALEGEDSFNETDCFNDAARPPTSVGTKLDRSQSSISFKSKRKGSSTSKRRKAESRMSNEVRSQKSKNLLPEEEYQCKSRCILQPGEKVSYCIRFFPTQTGIWQQTIPINFVTWGNGCGIYCRGICDIPKVDMTPEVVFPPPMPKEYDIEQLDVTGYLYSEKVYNFGAVIQTNDEKKSSEKNASFTLSNKTTLPVDLCVVLAQDATGDEAGGSSNVKFTPDKFFIKPGEKDQMNVTMSPSKVGLVTETLMLLVKDNPKIEFITLRSEGVRPNITVEPEELNFDRLLLRRKVRRPVQLKNNSNVPLYISVKDYEELPQQLSFSDTRGWIGPLKSMDIDVQYCSLEVQTIQEQMVDIKVYETEDAEEPVQELSFKISVEAYDAALDIIFDRKEDDHVDFGDIRVENDYVYVFNLKNQGKYPLGFKMDTDYQILAESQNDSFYINPTNGVLPPGKLFPVSVTFVAQNEVSWRRVPLLKLLLVEPYKGDEMIATIPIFVTARSHFSKYEITPEDHFNFGHIPVGSLKEGSLLIVNEGHFSFTYNIETQTTYNSPAVSEDALKKSLKYTASSKEKGDKVKKNPIVGKVGIFEISPNAGVVESGETAVVNIKCCPEEVKVFQEKVTIIVSESRPHLKQGNLVTVSAESCLPAVRFEDSKSVFREHFVCKTEEAFNSRVKVGSYTIYTENNNVFSFKNVCVNKTAEARIHLPNASVVECHVTAFITPALREDTSRTYLSSAGSHCFNVSESKLVIEPYNCGSVLLTFRPEALEVYKARLIFTLEMPDNFDDVVRTYDLWGNGVLPQIEITQPATKFSDGQALVNFPSTAVGNCSTSPIAITNVGTMDCKVIVEFFKFQNGVFKLIPTPDTRKMMKIWDLVKPIDHTAIVSMSPGETAEFNVVFSPEELQTYQSQIKLFIVDNPYENWCFKLVGDVVLEEVVIEKIRISAPFLAENENEMRLSSSNPHSQNHINFGDCNVGKKSKALLRLTNKTEKDYYKFEWEDIPNITVSPSAGHLYPNSYKEVLVIFQPEEPMEFEEIPISCTLSKIFLEFPSEPSWDTRLVQFQGQPKSDTMFSSPINDKTVSSSPQLVPEAVKISGEEPYYEVAPDFSKVLYLSLSGVVDYAKMNCETTKINFKNTFMFQNRIYPLTLENTGKITLQYELKLKSVTERPLKTNKMSQVSEKSLLNLQEKMRPQSSFGLPSLSNTTQESKTKSTFSKCDIRARPLTSASLLDLKNSPKCFESNVMTLEEQHTAKYNPFVIENVSGQIRPKEKACCNIIFSPMDINEYKALIVINVPNIHPECVLPEIEVTATSAMPFCHFNVAESDYLESGRRDHSRPGPIGYAPGIPLDPDTKTIEIKVLGVGSTIPIKFHVINPTEEDYVFSWINITQVQQEAVPSFHCATPEGRIGAGRQQEMIFSFASHKVGITESFWKFCIPKHEVETPFLLVGDVKEASVYFLPNHINLQPTTIGASSVGELTLINNEEIDFEFHFLPESFFSEGRLNVLKVEPTSGKILANSDVNIKVTFTGKTGGKTLFNLKCRVRTIQEPLSVTVQATAYVVQPLLAFEDLNKVKHYPDPNQETVLDFGTGLVPNRPETITLNMTSVTKPSFYYEWEYNKKILDIRFCKLRFTAKNGHVASFSRGTCNITIVFYKKSSLSNFPLKLKIRRGPTFNFVLNASACTPLCEFSFDKYDFEYCFLQEKDICFYETSLIIKNKENTDIVLEASLPDSSAFSYSLSTATIPPGDETSVRIYFHPKECIPYTDAIKFTVNGVHEKLVNLSGHGTNFKVTLSDPNDTTVSFGGVRIGKTCTRHFSLINRSLAPATLLLGFSDQLPVHGIHLTNSKENFIDLSEEHRLTGTIKISPSTPFRIKPQEEVKVRVVYTPHIKSDPFSETVWLQCQEKAEPICILTGCSLGPEISLDRTILNFGAVVETCSSTMKVKLVNSGNIGARFEWNTLKLENYDIYPASGYCSPESDVTIHVTFSPLDVQNCIKKTVECDLFLSDNETYPPLFLQLVGDCIGLPEAEETVYFECYVRETDQKTIIIENSTGNDWHLVPVFTGEYFKGVEALFVAPLSSATFEVNYCPLTMTKESDVHEGSVFFRLPNGQGLLYKLNGVSLPPNPMDVIEREIPCKTKYVELLKVQNWLKYPQRFRVNITREDSQDDPTCFCSGLEYLEIPGQGEKEYSLNFFAYNTGIQKFLVTFANEDTREYMWYDIVFNVVKCGPLETITLKSCVRQTCHHEIKLENPLTKTIFYTFETACPEIHFESESYEVPPEETVFARLSFTPLHSREVTEKLTAFCPDLGSFPRELRLISMEAKPGPPVIFETSLGTSVTEEFPIKNLSHLNAILRCRTTSDDFSVNEQASVSAGQIANVKVTYEPSDMDSAMATLLIESEQAGNFTFPLLGICVKPAARGPFILKPGSGINVPFKNVFKKSKEFHMFVDSSAFFLKSTQETIQPKEECKIYVGLLKTKHLEKLTEIKDKGLEPRFPVMGQLVVECFNPYVKWQFYLKGVIEK